MAEEIKKHTISFEGYNLYLRHLRTDKGVRVEIDVSQDQYHKIHEIPVLPEGLYKITIEPIKIEDNAH